MSKRAAAPAIEQSPAEKFFGLTRRPFSLTPDLRFAYHSRSHTHALDEVTSALRRREGLIVVTGAIGTGKTMLCRTLLETFEARTFLSLILDPGLQVEDLLRTVLVDFGIVGADAAAGAPPHQVTRHQFVTALQQFLASLVPLQAHAVIMIDEAQHLSPPVLEEIRLLSNFETDEAKLLQIVLVGQPDLDELLRRPDMQQLNQRVARRCQLHPLSPGEVADYIERRLTVAAADDALSRSEDASSPDPDLLVRFTAAATKTVATISAGIPRVVNTLCDRALDVAYEQQVRAIEPGIVVEAAERLQLEIPTKMSLPFPTGRRVPKMAAAAAIVAAAAAGTWWWMDAGGAAPRTSEGRSAVAAEMLAPAPAEPSAVSTFQPASAPPVVEPAAAPSAATGTVGTTAAPANPAPALDGSTSVPAAAPVDASASAVAEQYEIAVAAFRTEQRAQSVAEAVSALPVPAAVRLDATGTWYRVIAGPFATSEDAAAAQEMLTRSGYPGSRMSRSTQAR